MNNRIDSHLGGIKANHKKGLITFVTAGDPDLDATYELVLAMEKAGADLIELGIPFSDPVAEGPVIQKANVRALSHGIRLESVFELVKKLRKVTHIPLVFLMYANSLFRYGAEAFFNKCRECGVDGVIMPDLPYEEQQEFLPQAEKENIRIISLVSPASAERIKPIAGEAKGFLYCVSSLGVTGVRSHFRTDFESFMKKVYASAQVPAYLGFGISTPEQVKELRSYSDGVIVGSAIVSLIEESASKIEATKRISELTRSMREALDH